MKIAAVLMACLAMSIGADAAADPLHLEEKAWQYGAVDPRTVIPEQEPNDACPGQPMSIGDAIDPARIDVAGDNDWYAFEVSAVPQSVTIMTDASPSCDPDAGDTYVYLNAPDCVTQLAVDDDSGPGLYSLIANYIITYPGIYHIRVRHYSSSGTGCYKLYLTLPPPPPPNDRCILADPIERCTSGRVVADLRGAFNDYNPAIPGPSCTGYSAAGKDVTYLMNLAAGDLLAFTYTGDAFDASFYIVTDCDNVSGTCLVGADASYNVEMIEWGVPATGAYYLICDAYGTNTGGAFTLDYSVTCPPEAGACCFADGHCEFLREIECIALGGVSQGAGTSCDPNLCPQPAMACCFENGDCALVTAEECEQAGGSPQGFGTDCEPNDCPQPPAEGACCLGDQGDCHFVTQAVCGTLEGDYQGDGVPCEPDNPCPIVPTQNATWGRIKADYR